MQIFILVKLRRFLENRCAFVSHNLATLDFSPLSGKAFNLKIIFKKTKKLKKKNWTLAEL